MKYSSLFLALLAMSDLRASVVRAIEWGAPAQSSARPTPLSLSNEETRKLRQAFIALFETEEKGCHVTEKEEYLFAFLFDGRYYCR